jgi:flagellar basal-body rod modification protein FlgD
MDVSATSSTSAISEAAQARESLAGNFDTFLTLLTTQLQNQDPLSPLDSNEFTQQLVQFTSVEQQIAANENLEKILAAMQVEQTATALGFIGKQIDAETDTVGLGETGDATWTYDLPSNAQLTALTVSDASGKLVYVAKGETKAGPHVLAWDGTDNAGNRLPAGAYTLAVTASDANGTTLDTLIGVRGVVEGATTTADGEAAVLVAGTPIAVSTITRAITPPADTTAESDGGLIDTIADAVNDVL